MSIDRRDFLSLVSAAAMAYAFRSPATARAAEQEAVGTKPWPFDEVCAAEDIDIDYTQWLLMEDDGTVSAFTGRADMGQGLRTIIIALLTQAFDLPEKKVNVVMSDTDLCPDDGATNGSSATRQVAWGFWLAAHSVKADMTRRAAAMTGLDQKQLTFRDGRFWQGEVPAGLSIRDITREGVSLLNIEQAEAPDIPEYVDRGIRNVLSHQIVTGELKYVADLYPDGVVYGALVAPRYHNHLTKLLSADVTRARQVPGVLKAGRIKQQAGLVGTSFSAVQEGLEAIRSTWRKPKRPRKIDYVNEIRSGRKLVRIVEDTGNPDDAMPESAFQLSETYYTSSFNHCPIETDTAIADVQKNRADVWVSSQYAHKKRRDVAKKLKMPKEDVRAIGLPVGGGYGGKISNPVSEEAALLSRFADRPVKYIYSREDQFARRGRGKDACIIDLTTGVTADGYLHARDYAVHQDEGYGFTDVYQVPHSRVNLYHTSTVLRHAVIRGTSYVHDVFAMESHMDELARQIGDDPVEFRLRNLSLQPFSDLTQAAAEMIGYTGPEGDGERGIGMALVNHGARELGAVFVRLRVDRKSGTVRLEKICAAFDIGVVVNRNTVKTGVRGAMIWGIGFALKEELKLNGHVMKTRSLDQYDIARFSDVPEIDMRFLRVYPDDGPRGCGEMPVAPIAPAIGNAIRDATGARLHKTPFTPKRVRKVL